MRKIDRHLFERDPREAFGYPERTFARVRESLAVSDNPVDLLESEASVASDLGCFAGAVFDKPRSARGLTVLAEANAALFDLAAHPGVVVPVALDGVSYRLRVPQPHRMAGPGEWHDGFAAACAVRHVSALTTFVGVTKDVLDLSRMSARFYEFLYERIPGLQALAKRSSDAGALLSLALDTASQWDGDALERERYATEIALALRLHEGDAARFNDALERALLAHRAYWTAPANPDEIIDDRREHPHGFLALGVLGLACLAHDRGIPIDLESDYIPRWIVRRDW